MALVVSFSFAGCVGEVGGVGDDPGSDRSAFATGAAATAFHAAAPYRRLDTRSGGKLRERAPRCIAIAGRNGVPSTARAVALNLTVVGPAKHGWLVAYARGASRPGTSSLNFSPGRNVANGAVVKVGSGGQVCFYSVATTHLVVDVMGYFGSGSGYVALAPFRRVSERGSERPRSGATRCFRVAGRDGIPSNARAVVLNLAAAGARGHGYFTAYPKGQKRPGTSNLNYRPGGATANGAIVAVGSGGEVCVYVRTSADLIVDVSGYLASSADYRAVTPFRKVDTRKGSQPLDGSTRCYTVAGSNGVPKTARAVAFNIAVAQPLTAGYVVVRPAGRAQTATSSLNFAAGETRANNGVVAVGDRGRVCVYIRATTHFLLDIVGYWPANGTGPRPLSHPRTYEVSSTAAFLNAAETAVSGDTIAVASGASINLTEHKEIYVPGGVTISGGRTRSNRGALIYTNKRNTQPWYRNWSLLRTAGAGVRVRSLRLRGPDGTFETHGHFVATGVHASHAGLLVEGCELYNWPGAGVSVSAARGVVRNNWIHDNIRVGRGYGVVVGRTPDSVVIERNWFRRNRHAVAGSGYGSYVVRYNRFLDSDAKGVHTLIDMHGVNEHTLDNSTQQAGVRIHVHHNDIEYRGTVHPIIGIRGVPREVAVIEDNCVATTSYRWVVQGLKTAYPKPVSGKSCYEKRGTWLCSTYRYGSAMQNIVVRDNRMGRPSGCR